MGRWTCGVVLFAAFLIAMSGNGRAANAPASRPADPATPPATQPGGATTIEIDTAPARYERGPLGTRGYHATDKEKPFLANTPEEERATASILEKTEYDLAKRNGKRVAWFGIVRDVKKLPDGVYELQLEHKHFDGLTDLHILALSFNGGGDFVARVKSKDEPALKKLMLVRVYGVAAAAEGKPPTVEAEYLRGYPWKTFTFIECYGQDKTNPAWQKLCKVKPDDIYEPYPNEAYYRNRLGERE